VARPLVVGRPDVASAVTAVVVPADAAMPTARAATISRGPRIWVLLRDSSLFVV
jgi:hypothetical protein